jgi:hypothetical protein
MIDMVLTGRSTLHIDPALHYSQFNAGIILRNAGTSHSAQRHHRLTRLCSTPEGIACSCRSSVAKQQPRQINRPLFEAQWDDQARSYQSQNNPASRCGVTFLDTNAAGLAALPTVLYSIPGSGNTFVRHLIERGTGYFTGSACNNRFSWCGRERIDILPTFVVCIDYDADLEQVFPGEGHCRHTIAVKVSYAPWPRIDARVTLTLNGCATGSS